MIKNVWKLHNGSNKSNLNHTIVMTAQEIYAIRQYSLEQAMSICKDKDSKERNVLEVAEKIFQFLIKGI